MSVACVTEARVVRAAEYLRKSTEMQEFSIANQAVAIRAYASARGIHIVRSYVDEGKSGLTAFRRQGLKRLIKDVETGNADFQAILVYDVSRWGRFQDTDESSYYEYICKRAGIKIHYCAEQFENDTGPFAAIVKSIKRAMAAEYSRELSVKCFAGLSRVVCLGFHVGKAPYGTRRMLVGPSGEPKHVLQYGERKALRTDHNVLALGPPKEVEVVRWIFSAFVNERIRNVDITRLLNRRGVAGVSGNPWTPSAVSKILRNEVYIGNVIWNRTSQKLGARTRTRNPPEQWLRSRCRFEPIIERSLFDQAQMLIRERNEPYSKEEVLSTLRGLARQHGYLDYKLIKNTAGLPAPTTLNALFGPMRELFRVVGAARKPGSFYGVSDSELLARLKALLEEKGRLTQDIVNASRTVPYICTYYERFGSLKRAYMLIGYEPDRNNWQWGALKTRSMSNKELLAVARKLLREQGRLSASAFNVCQYTPSTATYRRRFGSLLRVYKLLGRKLSPQLRRAKPASGASAA